MAESNPNEIFYMAGYDFKTVDPSKEDENTCLICNLLIRKCTELPCGHAFCKCCLERWERGEIEKTKDGEIKEVKDLRKSEEEKKDDNDSTNLEKRPTVCIICRESYEEQEVIYSRRSDRLISNLEVYCQHKEEGCLWTGSIIAFEEHEQNNCVFKVIRCKLGNCQQMFSRKQQEEHENKCPYREVVCQHCEGRIQCINLERHQEECELCPIFCENKGCNKTLPRKQMINTHQEECHFKTIPCQFFAVGCKEFMLKSKQIEHNNQFNPHHTNLLLLDVLQNNKQKDSEYKALIKDLSATKDEVLKSQQKLLLKEQELVKTKQNLLKTQQSRDRKNEELFGVQKELSVTKTKLTETQNELELKKEELATKDAQLSEMNQKLIVAKQEIGTKNEELKEIKENFETTKQELMTSQSSLADAAECKEKQKNIIDKFLRLMQFSDMMQTPKEMFLFIGEDEAEQNFDPQLLKPFEYEGKAYDFGRQRCGFLTVDYETRIKMLLSKMEIGEICQIDEGKVIFKLQLVNESDLYIGNTNNTTSIQNEYQKKKTFGSPNDLILGNDHFAVVYLNVKGDVSLNFNIQLFKYENSFMFLHNVKREGQRHRLVRSTRINDLIWNEFKTADGHILFELTMK